MQHWNAPEAVADVQRDRSHKRRGAVTRRVRLGLVLALLTTSGLAQITQQDLDSCWSRGTTIAAQSRVQNCTRLIELGQQGAFYGKPLAEMYTNRGLAYHELHLTDRAIGDYTQAITIDPSLAEAYFNRGNTYGEEHLYDQAIADYTVAIGLAPDVPGYDNRGWTYEKMGRTDLAIADYRHASQLDPSDAYAESALKHLGASL